MRLIQPTIQRTTQFTLAAIAILLAACSPAAQAQTPPATSAAATATTVTVASLAPTPTAATPVDPTVAPTNTEPATVANATTAATPAAVAAVPAQDTQPYENLISPVDLLSSYYNAINLQDYERAYSYWQSPPLDYNTFAAGYNDTTSVQLIVQPPTRIDPGAGNLYAGIPTLLVAQHSDGSTHTYGGCIVTHKSNLHPPDIPQEDVWHLYQAQLEEVANNVNIPALLAAACAP